SGLRSGERPGQPPVPDRHRPGAAGRDPTRPTRPTIATEPAPAQVRPDANPTEAADADALALTLSVDLSARASHGALHAAHAEAGAAHTDTKPVAVPLTAKPVTAGRPAGLAQPSPLRSAGMTSKRLNGSRLVGLAVAVAAAAFAILVFIPFSLPWSHSLHLSVQAGAYGQLNPGAWVELSGSRVGSVDRVDYQNGYALIRVSIDPRYSGQLHADTTAAIRPHGLLGPKYVYLNGGRTGQLHEGASIPLSRTTVSTDFDQVLNSLQPDVRANLKTIFVELGRAADGRGATMNAGFQALGQSAADVSTTTTVLHNRADDLAALIAASERLAADLRRAPIDRPVADPTPALSGPPTAQH